MHGRLKVKTTAQQDAEKKQQRNEKLEAYEKAMQVIFATRKSLQIKNSPNVRLTNALQCYSITAHLLFRIELRDVTI